MVAYDAARQGPAAGEMKAYLPCDADGWAGSIGLNEISQLTNPAAWLKDDVLIPLSEIIVAAKSDKFIYIPLRNDCKDLLEDSSAAYLKIREQVEANPNFPAMLAGGTVQVLVTINIRNLHWALGHAELRDGKWTMRLYDSLSTTNNFYLTSVEIMQKLGLHVLEPISPAALPATADRLAHTPAPTSLVGSLETHDEGPPRQQEQPRQWTCELQPCKQQEDGHSCGIYTVINLMHIVCGRDVPTARESLTPELWRTVFLLLLRARTTKGPVGEGVVAITGGSLDKVLADLQKFVDDTNKPEILSLPLGGGMYRRADFAKFAADL